MNTFYIFTLLFNKYSSKVMLLLYICICLYLNLNRDDELFSIMCLDTAIRAK